MPAKRTHLTLAIDAPLLCDDWRAVHLIFKPRSRAPRWTSILRRRLAKVLHHRRLVGYAFTATMQRHTPVWHAAVKMRVRSQCAMSQCRMHLAELTSVPLTEFACAMAYASMREGMSQKVIAKMFGVQRAAVQQWEDRALRRKALMALADPQRGSTVTLNERIEQVIRRGEATADEVGYIAGCSMSRALEYLNELKDQGLIVAYGGSRNTSRTWKMAT